MALGVRKCNAAGSLGPVCVHWGAFGSAGGFGTAVFVRSRLLCLSKRFDEWVLGGSRCICVVACEWCPNSLLGTEAIEGRGE